MINYSYLNSYITYTLWLFNFIALSSGLVIIIDYYKNDTHIKDCSNIFTLICFGLSANVLPVLTFSHFREINVIIFFTSLPFVGYNLYNYITMPNSCKEYYSNEYNNLWVYYLVSFLSHFSNVILYTMKFSLEGRMSHIQEYIIANRNRGLNDEEILLQVEEPSRKMNEENMKNREDNIYENDSDLEE